MNIFAIITGIGLVIMGYYGTPSPLHATPNTATLVFLTGFIILAIGFNKNE